LPSETFRIHPDADAADYFVVHVAETLAKMRAAMTDVGVAPHPDQVACVVSTTSAAAPDLIGCLFVAQDYLCVSIVTHELAHAAFRAMERRGVRVRHWRRTKNWRGTALQAADTAEETYATAVEHLTREFWTEAQRLGIAG
jgi:hypothetical protein